MSRSTANGGQQAIRSEGRIPGRDRKSAGANPNMSSLSTIAFSTRLATSTRVSRKAFGANFMNHLL